MGYPNQDENEPGEGAMEMTECGCADKCMNKPDCVFETPATREIASLRAQLASARKALKPFAADKMPSLQKSKIAFNRDGFRCAMSPMEIASQAARDALTDDTSKVSTAQGEQK